MVYKWVGLDTQNSFKHDKSLKQLTVTVHRLIFRVAYSWKDICICDFRGLFLGGLIGILWYFIVYSTALLLISTVQNVHM